MKKMDSIRERMFVTDEGRKMYEYRFEGDK